MGGGWIVQAQDTADAVDFPPAKQDGQSLLDFPRPTQPAAAQTAPGTQLATP
jgi:hypothetical protein